MSPTPILLFVESTYNVALSKLTSPLNVETPVTFTVPLTSSFAFGTSLPIPILPSDFIRIASTTSPVPSFVPMEISDPLVPSYDAIVAS